MSLSVNVAWLPLFNEFALIIRTDLLSDDLDATLVMLQGEFWVINFKQYRNFEVSIEVFWVTLNNLIEETVGFRMVVLWLTGFDLSKHSECLVAIFKLIALQHSCQVEFCTLEIAQVVLDFGHAEVRLIILLIVFERLFVVFVGCLEIALGMLSFTENETKIWL